ncbi:hypothetical protein L226DRAFT_459207 [Lentinus tigrinus ALCF2SS1-7]|uniref:uncharacterized protein n=1 Tax=Lentinus tigrinus ALCF2SS1-7 TaxID=1328758 RepID=UPI0011660BF7|nr:hypothetical protein L226DRAFT_459207 [Lentinus tigrinus ALCF2SS1-7]
MWRSALRTRLCVLRPPSRQYARKASPSGSLRKQILYTTPSLILETFRKHCFHPDLTRLQCLRPGSLSIQDEQSSQSRLPTPHADGQWDSIVHASTLSSALNGIDTVLARHASSPISTRLVLPTWVVLSVLLKEPVTQVEAFTLHRLAMSQPPSHTAELGPLLILLSAYWLAKHRMYAPLCDVVLRTLQLRDSLHAYQLSLLLRILGQANTSREVQHFMSILLDVAIKRNLDLGVRTYRVLLENPVATLEVARLVERHMCSRSYAPNLSHTRAFLRIYGGTGRRRIAARYWRRIRGGEYYGPNAVYTMLPQQKHQMLVEHLRSFRSPKKMNMYIKYLLKSTARTREEPVNASSVSPPTLPRPDGISSQVWLQVLQIAARKSSISAEELLARFNAGKDHIGSPRKTLVAYFVAIKGLVRRENYAEAIELLEDVLPMKAHFDGPKLTKAVEALTMANRPEVALRLLLEFVHKQESSHSPATEHAARVVAGAQWKSLIYAPRSQLVDSRAINSFMACLLRIRRPDAVFYIWDTMPQVFHVEPDSTTFAILLKAARFARMFEGALQVAIADFGMGRILPNHNTEVELHRQRLGREQAVAGLEALLAPGAKHRVTGFWRGERAGDVALRVAWQVLVGNWPILASFSAPVRAVRRSVEEPASSPLADLFHSFAGDNGDDAAAGGSGHGQGQIRPYDEDGRTFFSIVPEDPAFRALIDLLATEERAYQIPLVLVWMRYLRVWPSRDTLATALVYWGEVTLEGPWWRARTGVWESGYIQLIKWISRWVGKRRMPREKDTHKALERVRWIRDFRGKRGARNSYGE